MTPNELRSLPGQKATEGKWGRRDLPLRYRGQLELGRILVKNLRAAVGYNVFGFRDGGLVGDGSQTDHGLYLHLGFKFDEDAFKRIADNSR